MTTLREAAQQALEALESCSGVPHWPALQPTIDALRTALAEPAQEPAAWMGAYDKTELYYRKPPQADVVPLYAAPPKAEPAQEPVAWAGYDLDSMAEAFSRVIEAHHSNRHPFHNPLDMDARMALRILRGFLPAMKAFTAPPKAEPLTNQCGETCERAKLCATCARALDEPVQEPYTGDVTRIMREAGMTFHLGLPHKAVVEQMTRVIDLVYAEASIKAAQQFAGALPNTEPAQEPVTWVASEDGCVIYDDISMDDVVLRVSGDFENDEQRIRRAKRIVNALNAAPPRRTMVPLTDEEILAAVGWERAEMYIKLTPNFPVNEAKKETLKNARAIEKASWEKNQ